MKSLLFARNLAPLSLGSFSLEMNFTDKISSSNTTRNRRFISSYIINLFRYECIDPYKTLDHTHHRICAMEKFLEELSNWASLFEVPVPEFRGLKNCRRETIMLKQLWDYSYVIRSSVDNWKTTHWKEIDVERMEIECKHFAKNIRGLDKEMRAWDAYIGLDASVRDLLTSLKVTFKSHRVTKEAFFMTLGAFRPSLSCRTLPYASVTGCS